MISFIALKNGDELWVTEDLEELIARIKKADRFIEVVDGLQGLVLVNLDEIVIVYENEAELFKFDNEK